MARPRFRTHFRIALLGAGVFGAIMTATPHARTQSGGRQVRVPTIAVPRVSVPVVQAPGAPVTPAIAALQQSRSRRLTTARAEAFVQAARLGLDYLPGEVIVKFKAGMGPADQTRALTVLAASPTADALEWRGPVAVVRDETEPNAYVLADRLRAQPEVEYAEPNFIAKIDPRLRDTSGPSVGVVPTRATFVRSTRGGGSRFGRIRGVPADTDYLGFQWNFGLINMPQAWDIQPGGDPGIIVAVIDTGITVVTTTMTFPLWTGSSFQNVSLPYAVNPDLPASRLVLPRDNVLLEPNGPVLDMDGHGTHVSATIGETTNNGLLVAGIAYNARIMPIKACAQYWDILIRRGLDGTPGSIPKDSGGCLFSDIADGLHYAVDNGARVINISIGGPSASITLQNALTYAVSKGAFVAVSMGNGFEDGNPVEYPSAYAAGLDGMMSVAAVGWDQAKAWYSSTGAHCEISAPGGDLRSGIGRGDSGAVWQSTLLPGDVSPFQTIPRFDRYNKVGYSGTSQAAPHVAGIAALLISQMPNLTPAQVEKIIRATAKDLGTVGRDDVFGFGLIQPRAALFGRGISR